MSYDRLNAEAKALPPGAEGLVVLDHFQGNRTPYTDAHARGVISGLTLRAWTGASLPCSDRGRIVRHGADL
jgi:ribulose kinase